MYWTLAVDVLAPCGHVVTDWQTHYMGEAGSCINYYPLGAAVEELGTYSGPLPREDWFISDCRPCGAFYSLPADIEQGRVIRVGTPVATA